MKKIKSVKLLKDLPGIKAGESVNGDYGFSYYSMDAVRNNPDFFEITYEEDETVHILLDVEVRKDYYDGSDTECFNKLFKNYYNQASTSVNPIISVKEVSSSDKLIVLEKGTYKLKLEKL